MDLFQTFAVIIIILFIVHYIMVNVLNIPFKDLIKTPGQIQINGNSKDQDQDLGHEQGMKLSEINNNLRKEFGLSDQLGQGDTSNAPTKFLEQAIYDPTRERTHSVDPANNAIYEKEAEFGSEQTNISQFFATNPGVFLNNERHNAYVPDTSVWSQQGSNLYTDLLNSARVPLQPYGYDKNLAMLGT